jgi:hypothetical protein
MFAPCPPRSPSDPPAAHPCRHEARRLPARAHTHTHSPPTMIYALTQSKLRVPVRMIDHRATHASTTPHLGHVDVNLLAQRVDVTCQLRFTRLHVVIDRLAKCLDQRLRVLRNHIAGLCRQPAAAPFSTRHGVGKSLGRSHTCRPYRLAYTGDRIERVRWCWPVPVRAVTSS